MKFCKDCKFFKAGKDRSLWRALLAAGVPPYSHETDWCLHPNTAHPLTGARGLYPLEVRHDERLCGADAKWFGAKDNTA